MTHQEALQLVIAHSGAAFKQANKAMLAIHTGSPIAAQRVRSAIETALDDGAATFTPEDRYALGGMLAELTPEMNRSETLQIRLTAIERAELAERAKAAHLSVSAYVRQQLGLE